MIDSNSGRTPRTRTNNRVSFESKPIPHSPTQYPTKSHRKQKFSIQELLNQSSIEKIEPTQVGRGRGRRDRASQSPQHWMGDTSKQNINILIMNEKEIDLFQNVFDQHFSLGDEENHVHITNENEDQNYQMLRMEYERLMKQGVSDSSDQKEQEQIITRILNISQIQERKREDDMYNSRRESILEQKIQDIVKIVRRIVSMKSENKILNSSINMSRHSEFKQSINKNLFEINQEWDNIQGGNKGGRAEDSGFYLKDQNSRVLQEDLFKGNQSMGDEDERRKEASNIIKRCWRRYKEMALIKPGVENWGGMEEGKINQLETIHSQLKVEKQEDFNHILNQLDESSNNINNDKSQQLSLEYKQLNLLISNKNIAKINSNSFCQQKRKKIQGDSLVLQQLGSISAIRSTSKFRQASEHDESEIKEEDSRYYYQGLNNMLRMREIWVREKSKENFDENWRRRELDLVEKMRKIIINPYEVCMGGTKEMGTNTTDSLLAEKRVERSFDLKDRPRLKQSFKNPRPLIQRRTTPKLNHRANLIKEKDKEITYIQDKKINIILTKDQLRKLMSRETITNDIDIFNENEDISVETEQILTQLNFSENQIAPVKTRRIKYNIQLEDRSFNDSVGR